jgi:prepilin-type N-terminal cleavage/methylation domain-containing protein
MLKKIFKKFKNYKIKNSRALFTRSGQSLIEILIALAIGSILIGAATLGIAFMIRSTATNQRLQVASGFARDMIEKLRSWSASDWQNIYLLEKGTSTKYFLAPSGMSFLAIQGEEGMLENDARVGLVGKWGFDEATGTTVYDSAGGNATGTFVGSPVRLLSDSCELGGCLSFSGTDSVVIPNTTSTDPTGAWTLSAWVNISTNNTENPIIEKYEWSGLAGNFAFRVNGSNKLIAYVYSGTAKEDCGNTLTVIQKNTWYFLTATYDGTLQKLVCYVNGAPESANAGLTISPQRSNNVPLRIGCSGNDCSQKFNGIIDDARIYSRALSATEIKNLYQSKIFSRYFTIQNTCRKTGEVNIVPASSTSCGLDYFEDPSTQQASVFVQWPAVGNVAELKLVEYITRWRNEVLHEQNWSGGGAQEGPITSPNGKFASSTNIDINSYGIIKVRPE